MSRIMDLLVIGTAVLTANLSNARAEGPAAETLEWTLRTADTTLSVGIDGERGMVIRRLCGPDGWNWTAADSPLPLIGRIDVAEVQTIPKWNYRGAAVDKSDGRQLTITFANALPAMELKSVWQARPGPGPIRQAMFITNRSDKPVTIYEQESLQVHLASPGQKAAEQTTLTCIKNDASVPDATGVYREPLVRGYRKELPIAEHDGSFIPFVAVDAGGARGVYLGWEWSIGRIAVTGNAASGATIKVGNGDGFRTNLAPGATFEVPPAFIGAYRGDLDDAANSLHKYLFRYSMPPALRQRPHVSQGGMERLRRHGAGARKLAACRGEILSTHRRHRAAGVRRRGDRRQLVEWRRDAPAAPAGRSRQVLAEGHAGGVRLCPPAWLAFRAVLEL